MRHRHTRFGCYGDLGPEICAHLWLTKESVYLPYIVLYVFWKLIIEVCKMELLNKMTSVDYHVEYICRLSISPTVQHKQGLKDMFVHTGKCLS